MHGGWSGGRRPARAISARSIRRATATCRKPQRGRAELHELVFTANDDGVGNGGYAVQCLNANAGASVGLQCLQEFRLIILSQAFSITRAPKAGFLVRGIGRRRRDRKVGLEWLRIDAGVVAAMAGIEHSC